MCFGRLPNLPGCLSLVSTQTKAEWVICCLACLPVSHLHRDDEVLLKQMNNKQLFKQSTNGLSVVFLSLLMCFGLEEYFSWLMLVLSYGSDIGECSKLMFHKCSLLRLTMKPVLRLLWKCVGEVWNVLANFSVFFLQLWLVFIIYGAFCKHLPLSRGAIKGLKS